MEKNIILAGKEFTKNSDLEKIAQTLGLNPFVTTQYFEESNTKIISTNTTWNRSSPISAHSVIINAENYFGQIDGAVLFFDSLAYDKIFVHNTLDEFTRATDELILGYNYLTLELLRRFSDKNPGKLFFVLQSQETQADALKNPSKQQMPQQSIGLVTSMAQSAFKSFAENIAALNFNPNGNFVYLLEVSSEVSEEEILSWISTKMQENLPVYKNPKNAVTWQSTENKSKFQIPFMK
ncbi:MAG: hypothetical protein II232_04065 [Spirochaetaceae bacterium]|nr:hypothetical protein [Spirochaetaceae bacterium]